MSSEVPRWGLYVGIGLLLISVPLWVMEPLPWTWGSLLGHFLFSAGIVMISYNFLKKWLSK